MHHHPLACISLVPQDSPFLPAAEGSGKPQSVLQSSQLLCLHLDGFVLMHDGVAAGLGLFTNLHSWQRHARGGVLVPELEELCDMLILVRYVRDGKGEGGGE